MADTVMAINYIVKTPGMLGGDPRIAGRRIGVHDVVLLHNHLNTPPEEIATIYDLSMAEVYAALAYYYDHREEIDTIIDENQRMAEAIPANPRAAEVEARAAQREREDREKKNSD
jgi:uncharacterized protein (DUF433 family)